MQSCQRGSSLEAVRYHLARNFIPPQSQNLSESKNPEIVQKHLDDTVSRKSITAEAQNQSEGKKKMTIDTRIETTRPMVLFLNTQKEVLSSAPTSPNSSDGESYISANPLEIAGNSDNHKRLTKLPPSGSWRKRRGLMFRCGPFFGRPQPGSLNSPYQSDVSQSAPSSPTIDTYETLPLVPNAASIARVPVSHEIHTDYLTVHKNTLLRSTDSSEFQYERMLTPSNSAGLSLDNQPRPDATLLCLMKRLGVQSVWPCLLEHGIGDVRRLSKLTRSELIEMGVTDAETRATLMTAAQLLTDSWLHSPATSKPSPQLQKTYNGRQEQQNLRDSGISSGTDFSSPNNFSPSNDFVLCNTPILNHSRYCEPSVFNCRTGSVENITSRETNHSVRSRLNSATPLFSSKVVPSQCLSSQPPRHLSPPTIQHIKQKSGGLKNISAIFGTSTYSGQNLQDVQQFQLKQPVGILRNARGSRDSHCDGRNPDNVRRSSSTTPKTVKIDERFLTPLKDQRLQPPLTTSSTESTHYIAQFPNTIGGNGISLNNNINTIIGLDQPAMVCPHPTSQNEQPELLSNVISCPATRQGYNFTSVMNQLPSSMDQTRFLRQYLREKLQSEGIDLTKSPYSDEVGKANIPLRLMQRYSFEIQCELTKVALAIEAERDAKLRESGRPVVSFVGDIQSQRFLNCEGIKTGTLHDFLIGIGLPMYIDRIKRARRDPKLNPMTPADLLKMPDEDLIKFFGFTPDHVHWLRHEAAAIPWTLLAQSLSVHTRSGHICSGLHTNSLQRSSSVGLRSTSQTRKAHRAQTQVMNNTSVLPDNYRDKV